jgi:hypothetical protein
MWKLEKTPAIGLLNYQGMARAGHMGLCHHRTGVLVGWLDRLTWSTYLAWKPGIVRFHGTGQSVPNLVCYTFLLYGRDWIHAPQFPSSS